MRVVLRRLFLIVGMSFGLSAIAADESGHFEITAEFAGHFADDWIAAWNSHNLEQILSHYEEDFEMSSPMIRVIYEEPSGRLKGKQAVGDYWALALERNPDLNFTLHHTLIGAQSITLVYDGLRGLVAETFLFSDTGKVAAAFAQYE
jgi:hypothetical protein